MMHNFKKLIFILFSVFYLSLAGQEIGGFEGAITIENSISETPKEGTVRWNPSNKDFEGFDGTKWISLTNKSNGWGKDMIHTEDQLIEPDDIEEEKYFGWSLDAEGDLLAVGSFNDVKGQVHIFERNTNGSWEQIFEIIPSDLDTREFFGRSVAVSGNYIAVAVDGQDTSSSTTSGLGAKTGSAYIFYYDGVSLIQEARLFSPGTSNFDDFGKTIEMDDGIVAVSATGNTVSPGVVYLYHKVNSSWVLLSTLKASDETDGNNYGRSVSIDNGRILIGAISAGKAYAYESVGTDWTNEQIVLPSDGALYFGGSVSLSGDRALIGAYGNASAYVFKWNNTNWVETAKIISPEDNFSSGLFGQRVSLEGNIAVIGAYGKDFDDGYDIGAVYVFCESQGLWGLQATLRRENGETNDFFGRRLVISGNTIFVSAEKENHNNTVLRSGGVFVFPK